ncbi:MAG: efflux RND transporter periplasmic adaptor subunit [Nitrospira defluvii]|nr:efflux RND transporter periplasmic adaptor subunit [Nitrospira defluvii]
MSGNNKSAVKTGWIGLSLLLLAGCGQEPSRPEGGLPEKTVQPAIQATVMEVKTSQVPVTVEVTGQVTAVYQATLASRIQGTIDNLLVREGSLVRKGQTLVMLDNRDLQAELSRVTAELDNAKAQWNRMTDLYKRDAVSKQELENATRTFKVTEAGRNAVMAQLSYTVVKAPFDGVITEKKVEMGELASPGQSLLKMENPDQLRLEATVAESDIRVVSVGASIPVIIDALGPHPLQGRVSQILPAGDPQTHTFTMKADLPRTAGLKSGMFGRLRLETGMSTTLFLPKSVFIERGELASLFVVGSDHVARLQWVKVGRMLEQGVEILSGVNAGERVILDATKGRDGALVQDMTAVALPTQTP